MSSELNDNLDLRAERGDPIGSGALLDLVESRLMPEQDRVIADAPPRRLYAGWMFALAAALLVGLVVGAAAVSDPFSNSPRPAATTSPVAEVTGLEVPPTTSPVEPQDALVPFASDRSWPTGGTPLPDITGALPGDDGAGPLPLGAVATLPANERLDFLFEFCRPECYRDAHWMDPANPDFGSGVWEAGRPFHIRHGFINNTGEPLGPGFDVVVYVTQLDDPGEFGGVATAATVRYTSDYVVQGVADQCGPTYKAQTGPQTCEWFVHDFPEGLPRGRHAVWALWEAPCRAWLEMGLTDGCGDPEEVISLFSSGFDGPHEDHVSFTELNEAQLTAEEIAERMWVPFDVPMVDPATVEEIAPSGNYDEVVVPAGGDPSLDLRAGRLPVSSLPGSPYLDFHNARCWDRCFRDAVMVDQADETMGIGVWAADAPFHIRHGFVNETGVPLDEGFDVVVSVTRREGPASEDVGFELGRTYRFSPDYVVQATASKCGPGYWEQTEPSSCEWFVHDFPDGLPAGRYDLWVEWHAPCSAWLDLALVESCADPDEVSAEFLSTVNMPFYNHEYPEGMPPPYDPATLFAEDPQPVLRGVSGS